MIGEELMEQEECILLDCPKCSIIISVKVADLFEARDFPCPICADLIRFDFPREELDRIVEENRSKQKRDLKRAFRMSFGDV